LKFERKIYQLFGLSLGRPIKLKTVLYFIIFLVIELGIYFTPYIGSLIRWLPAIYLIFIPAIFAYLLSGVRTEGRTTIAFFRSFILYHLRKRRDVTYRRGREIKKPRRYRFEGYATITFAENRVTFIPRKIKFKNKGKISVTRFMEKELLKYIDYETK
jgi:TcpE family